MKKIIIISVLFFLIASVLQSQQIDRTSGFIDLESKTETFKFRNLTYSSVEVEVAGIPYSSRNIFSSTNALKFQVDTVRNPNNKFLYYYFEASVLGYPEQYFVKMEDGVFHLAGRVNNKNGFVIWCLQNWEYFTDSISNLQK